MFEGGCFVFCRLSLSPCPSTTYLRLSRYYAILPLFSKLTARNIVGGVSPIRLFYVRASEITTKRNGFKQDPWRKRASAHQSETKQYIYSLSADEHTSYIVYTCGIIAVMKC